MSDTGSPGEKTFKCQKEIIQQTSKKMAPAVKEGDTIENVGYEEEVTHFVKTNEEGIVSETRMGVASLISKFQAQACHQECKPVAHEGITAPSWHGTHKHGLKTLHSEPEMNQARLDPQKLHQDTATSASAVKTHSDPNPKQAFSTKVTSQSDQIPTPPPRKSPKRASASGAGQGGENQLECMPDSPGQDLTSSEQLAKRWAIWEHRTDVTGQTAGDVLPWKRDHEDHVASYIPGTAPAQGLSSSQSTKPATFVMGDRKFIGVKSKVSTTDPFNPYPQSTGIEKHSNTTGHSSRHPSQEEEEDQERTNGPQLTLPSQRDSHEIQSSEQVDQHLWALHNEESVTQMCSDSESNPMAIISTHAVSHNVSGSSSRDAPALPSELTQSDRIAKYKEDRRKQLAYIAAKCGVPLPSQTVLNTQDNAVGEIEFKSKKLSSEPKLCVIKNSVPKKGENLVCVSPDSFLFLHKSQEAQQPQASSPHPDSRLLAYTNVAAAGGSTTASSPLINGPGQGLTDSKSHKAASDSGHFSRGNPLETVQTHAVSLSKQGKQMSSVGRQAELEVAQASLMSPQSEPPLVRRISKSRVEKKADAYKVHVYAPTPQLMSKQSPRFRFKSQLSSLKEGASSLGAEHTTAPPQDLEQAPKKFTAQKDKNAEEMHKDGLSADGRLKHISPRNQRQQYFDTNFSVKGEITDASKVKKPVKGFQRLSPRSSIICNPRVKVAPNIAFGTSVKPTPSKVIADNSPQSRSSPRLVGMGTSFQTFAENSARGKSITVEQGGKEVKVQSPNLRQNFWPQHRKPFSRVVYQLKQNVKPQRQATHVHKSKSADTPPTSPRPSTVHEADKQELASYGQDKCHTHISKDGTDSKALVLQRGSAFTTQAESSRLLTQTVKVNIAWPERTITNKIKPTEVKSDISNSDSRKRSQLVSHASHSRTKASPSVDVKKEESFTSRHRNKSPQMTFGSKSDQHYKNVILGKEIALVSSKEERQSLDTKDSSCQIKHSVSDISDNLRTGQETDANPHCEMSKHPCKSLVFTRSGQRPNFPMPLDLLPETNTEVVKEPKSRPSYFSHKRSSFSESTNRAERLERLKKEEEEAVARFHRFLFKSKEVYSGTTTESQTVTERAQEVKQCCLKVSSMEEAKDIANSFLNSAYQDFSSRVFRWQDNDDDSTPGSRENLKKYTQSGDLDASKKLDTTAAVAAAAAVGDKFPVKEQRLLCPNESSIGTNAVENEDRAVHQKSQTLKCKRFRKASASPGELRLAGSPKSETLDEDVQVVQVMPNVRKIEIQPMICIPLKPADNPAIRGETEPSGPVVVQVMDKTSMIVPLQILPESISPKEKTDKAPPVKEEVKEKQFSVRQLSSSSKANAAEKRISWRRDISAISDVTMNSESKIEGERSSDVSENRIELMDFQGTASAGQENSVAVMKKADPSTFWDSAPPVVQPVDRRNTLSQEPVPSGDTHDDWQAWASKVPETSEDPLPAASVKSCLQSQGQSEPNMASNQGFESNKLETECVLIIRDQISEYLGGCNSTEEHYSSPGHLEKPGQVETTLFKCCGTARASLEQSVSEYEAGEKLTSNVPTLTTTEKKVSSCQREMPVPGLSVKQDIKTLTPQQMLSFSCYENVLNSHQSHGPSKDFQKFLAREPATTPGRTLPLFRGLLVEKQCGEATVAIDTSPPSLPFQTSLPMDMSYSIPLEDMESSAGEMHDSSSMNMEDSSLSSDTNVTRKKVSVPLLAAKFSLSGYEVPSQRQSSQATEPDVCNGLGHEEQAAAAAADVVSDTGYQSSSTRTAAEVITTDMQEDSHIKSRIARKMSEYLSSVRHCTEQLSHRKLAPEEEQVNRVSVDPLSSSIVENSESSKPAEEGEDRVSSKGKADGTDTVSDEDLCRWELCQTSQDIATDISSKESSENTFYSVHSCRKEDNTATEIFSKLTALPGSRSMLTEPVTGKSCSSGDPKRRQLVPDTARASATYEKSEGSVFCSSLGSSHVPQEKNETGRSFTEANVHLSKNSHEDHCDDTLPPEDFTPDSGSSVCFELECDRLAAHQTAKEPSVPEHSLEKVARSAYNMTEMDENENLAYSRKAVLPTPLELQHAPYPPVEDELHSWEMDKKWRTDVNSSDPEKEASDSEALSNSQEQMMEGISLAHEAATPELADGLSCTSKWQHTPEEKQCTETTGLESLYSRFDVSADSFNSLFLQNAMYLEDVSCEEQEKDSSSASQMLRKRKALCRPVPKPRGSKKNSPEKEDNKKETQVENASKHSPQKPSPLHEAANQRHRLVDDSDQNISANPHNGSTFNSAGYTDNKGSICSATAASSVAFSDTLTCSSESPTLCLSGISDLHAFSSKDHSSDSCVETLRSPAETEKPTEAEEVGTHVIKSHKKTSPTENVPSSVFDEVNVVSVADWPSQAQTNEEAEADDLEYTSKEDMDSRRRRHLLERSSDAVSEEPSNWRSKVYQNENRNASNSNSSSHIREARQSHRSTDSASSLDKHKNDVEASRDCRRRRSDDSSSSELAERLARRRATRQEETWSADGSVDSSRPREGRCSRDGSVPSGDSNENGESDDKSIGRRSRRRESWGLEGQETWRSSRRSSRESIQSVDSVDNNVEEVALTSRRWSRRGDNEVSNAGVPEMTAMDFRARKWSSKDSSFKSADSTCSFKSCDDGEGKDSERPPTGTWNSRTSGLSDHTAESSAACRRRMRHFQECSEDSAFSESKDKNEDQAFVTSAGRRYILPQDSAVSPGTARRRRIQDFIDECEESTESPLGNGSSVKAEKSSDGHSIGDSLSPSRWRRHIPLTSSASLDAGLMRSPRHDEGEKPGSGMDADRRGSDIDENVAAAESFHARLQRLRGIDTEADISISTAQVDVESGSPSADIKVAQVLDSATPKVEEVAPGLDNPLTPSSSSSSSSAPKVRKRRLKKDKSALRKSPLNMADKDNDLLVHEGNSLVGSDAANQADGKSSRRRGEGTFVSQHASFWENHAPSSQHAPPPRQRTNIPTRYLGDLSAKISASRQKFSQNVAAAASDTTTASSSKSKPDTGSETTGRKISSRSRTDFSQLLQKFSGSESNSEKSDSETGNLPSTTAGLIRRKGLVQRQEAKEVVSSSEDSDTCRRTPERTQSLKLVTRREDGDRVGESTNLPGSRVSLEKSASFRSEFMSRRLVQKAKDEPQIQKEKSPSPAPGTLSSGAVKTDVDNSIISSRVSEKETSLSRKATSNNDSQVEKGSNPQTVPLKTENNTAVKNEHLPSLTAKTNAQLFQKETASSAATTSSSAVPKARLEPKDFTVSSQKIERSVAPSTAPTADVSSQKRDTLATVASTTVSSQKKEKSPTPTSTTSATVASTTVSSQKKEKSPAPGTSATVASTTVSSQKIEKTPAPITASVSSAIVSPQKIEQPAAPAAIVASTTVLSQKIEKSQSPEPSTAPATVACKTVQEIRDGSSEKSLESQSRVMEEVEDPGKWRQSATSKDKSSISQADTFIKKGESNVISMASRRSPDKAKSPSPGSTSCTYPKRSDPLASHKPATSANDTDKKQSWREVTSGLASTQSPSLERPSSSERQLQPTAPSSASATTDVDSKPPLSSSVSSSDIQSSTAASDSSGVRRASSFRDVSVTRTESIEKRKGILKRNPSLTKHDTLDTAVGSSSFPIIDPQLAKILQQRKQIVGDGDKKDEAEEDIDPRTPVRRRSTALSAAEEIEETLRYSHVRAVERGLDPEEDEGLKKVSVSDRIFSMQTKIEEEKYTPKSRSGVSTPRSRPRSGVLTPTQPTLVEEMVEQKVAVSDANTNNNSTAEQSEQTSSCSVLSGSQLMERLSKIADSTDSYQNKRQRFQHRNRNDWRHQTQPVTYEEIQAADSLETVSAFRALVRKQTSFNALEQMKSQTSVSKQNLLLGGKKTEFPQHLLPAPKHQRRSRRQRHRTLPVTAEELNAVPENQMLVTDPDWVKYEESDRGGSKADSGILSGSDASLFDHSGCGNHAENWRSQSLDLDLSETDPSRLSVNDKTSIFKSLEEKTKADREKEKSASGAKRYINRKKRERSQTMPITDDEVKTACEMGDGGTANSGLSSRVLPSNLPPPEVVIRSRSSSGGEDGDKEHAEDELTKLSLTEKVKLFSQLKDKEKTPPTKTEVPMVRRRNRKQTSRFSTQPVTSEEVEKAAAVSRISPLAMSMIKPPDPEILKTLPLKDQRELMAQHAEMFLSQSSLRSSLSQPSSRRASLTQEASDDTKQDEVIEDKSEKKGILKDKSASTKDLNDMRSILKTEPSKAKSEPEVHSILKTDVRHALESTLISPEPRGILKKTRSEDIPAVDSAEDIKSILKRSDSDEDEHQRKPRSRSNSQPLGILKSDSSPQAGDQIKGILKAPSQENIQDSPVIKSALRRGSMDSETTTPSAGLLRSALKNRSKMNSENEEGQSDLCEVKHRPGLAASPELEVNVNNSNKHVDLTLAICTEQRVDRFVAPVVTKEVSSTSSFIRTEIQPSSSITQLQALSSSQTSSENSLQVPKSSDVKSSDDDESSCGEILEETPTTSKLKKKSRFSDRAARSERYKTQPPELTRELSPSAATPTPTDSTPRRKYKYEGRHRTQPITPDEMREAEATTPVTNLSRTPGGSIADRLNQLKTSGEEDWKKRVGTPDVVIKLREKSDLPAQRPSSIADRLSELETSKMTWRVRVEETDVKQFTVAGKLPSSTTESPLVTKLKNLPRKEEAGSKGSSPASSPVTPTKEFIAKIPLPKDIVQDHTVRIDPRNKQPITAEEEEKKKAPVKVEVPNMGEEIEEFFAVKSIDEIKDKVQVDVDDFNNIFIEAEMILPIVRKVKPARKTKASSHNPLKVMSQKMELLQEYTEVCYGTAEKELRRVKREGLAKDAGFAQAALAGLASKENFKQVELRRSDSGSSPHGQKLDPFNDLMLLHIKGRRIVQTRLVEPNSRSINEGDCYVVVTPDKVVHWEGRFANVIEKAKASEIASFIQQKKDLGCKKANEVNTVYQSKDHLGAGKLFWAALEGEKQVQACGPDAEDELYESSVVKSNMVYRLDGNALLPYEEYWGTIPQHEMLKKNEVLVFDFGSEFYMWQGKAVSMEQRKLGLKLAKQLYEKGYDYTESAINLLSPLRTEADGGLPVKAASRPKWAIFGKVNQNMETILFREKFADWPDSSRLIGCKGHGSSETVSKELQELKPFDAARMLSVNTAPVTLKLEGADVGRGVKWAEDMQGFIKEQDIITLDVTVWHVNEYDHFKLPASSHGQFHDGDTYVIRWQYMIANANLRSLKGQAARNSLTGRERCAYFFWQGNNSTINEKGASALMTVELDEERGPQVRVLEGKEPPCFLNLFGGNMMIHIGKREDPATNTQGSWRLYCLRGDYENEVCLLEIPVCIDHLRSRSSLLLVNIKTGLVYIWHGAKSPQHERKLCRKAVERLKEKSPLELGLHEKASITAIEVEEGEEKKEIWSALDSRDRLVYQSLLTDPKPYQHTLRLFHMSSVNLVFEVHEQLNPARVPDLCTPFPFLQADLYKSTQPALFLVDNHHEVYLWQGWWPIGSHDTENVQTGSATARFNLDRRCALETTLHYCKEKNSAQPPTAYLVCAGIEPPCFASLFPYWIVDTLVRDMALEEGKILGYKEKVSDILHRLTQTRYTLAELQERPLPEGVDPLKLESYLDDAEFEELLDMNREEFYAQPAWKQRDMKKHVGLF